MPSVIYIHGFLSSPLSRKAQATKKWFAENHCEINFICPALSSYPQLAVSKLNSLIHSLGNEKIFVIGSSLGGFWATYLLESNKAEKAVLINPAVEPQNIMSRYLGQELKSFYTEETFVFREGELQQFKALDSERIRYPEKYWVMLQAGDETLDYHCAAKKYSACRQLIEEGGSHTFEGYENWLPEIAKFFDI